MAIGRLETWDDLGTRYEWPTLLVGNGASVNIWQRFRYKSLFEEANLSDEAREVFDAMGGDNFEAALEYIHHARIVNRALGLPVKRIKGLYRSVRDALFEAVNKVHIRRDDLSDDKALRFAEAVTEPTSVFTTNYDLIMYWSLMRDGSRYWNKITDLFIGPSGGDVLFDPYRNAHTTLYYLHGAIHLWQDDFGTEGKWTTATVKSGNLLRLADHYKVGEPRRPLFVSEGNAEQKLRTIRRSPYLSHCLKRLTDNTGNTVVFGLSLGPTDQHVAKALDSGPKRRIAFSIRPGDPKVVEAEKARLVAAFPRHDVMCFDSETHPLGDPTMRMAPPKTIKVPAKKAT